MSEQFTKEVLQWNCWILIPYKETSEVLVQKDEDWIEIAARVCRVQDTHWHPGRGYPFSTRSKAAIAGETSQRGSNEQSTMGQLIAT